MSAALVILPMVWATAQVERAVEEAVERKPVIPLAFYRKYTEALLRRYAHMAMEDGQSAFFIGKGAVSRQGDKLRRPRLR
jgi:hypothetical protein